jgi:glycosyltransferase involved in cell wall biosynthesis
MRRPRVRCPIAFSCGSADTPGQDHAHTRQKTLQVSRASREARERQEVLIDREELTRNVEIAILIPCYNEASAIGSVVTNFARVFPTANIYVYDNNSSDETAVLAAAAGAIVRRERMQGKGHVIRRMFADIDADVYVMVDGDATYDAGAAVAMVRRLVESGLDLVNGYRFAADATAYRRGHGLGNRILNRIVSTIFGHHIRDMMSGLKVFSRRFVKSFPCIATGFEIETEMTVHALELAMTIDELPVAYTSRIPGSASKLRTVRDGVRVGWLIFRLLRAERPLIVFGSIFVVLASTSSLLGLKIYREWRATGLVLRIPTAILTTGMMLLAFLSAACGLILETVTLGRREAKRMQYLTIAPPPCGRANERVTTLDSLTVPDRRGFRS